MLAAMPCSPALLCNSCLVHHPPPNCCTPAAMPAATSPTTAARLHTTHAPHRPSLLGTQVGQHLIQSHGGGEGLVRQDQAVPAVVQWHLHSSRPREGGGHSTLSMVSMVSTLSMLSPLSIGAVLGGRPGGLVVPLGWVPCRKG